MFSLRSQACPKAILEIHGHNVETAGDVATGLQAAMQSDFDLLISDLGLPDGSGLDLIRRLSAGGRKLPAIALSGYGQQKDTEDSRAAGFAIHLVKPVDVHHLLDAIAKLV